ncbi:MAG: PCMD domain-containing protein [Bacteroidales bacterium]
MKHKYLVLSLITILGISLAWTSCKKDDDDDNQPQAPAVFDPIHVYSTYFYVSWSSQAGINGYIVELATDAGFSNIVPGYGNKDVGAASILEISGLQPNTSYYFHVKSYGDGEESVFSGVKEIRTAGMDTVRNMNFERWVTHSNYENPAPVGVWATANKVKDLNPGLYPATTEKTTDAQEGDYAARMFTAIAQGLPLITGSVATGVFTVDLSNPLKSLVSGVPYRTKPERFNGYFKYYPGYDLQKEDSCEIRATLFRWDAMLGKRDTIGEAIHRTSDSIKEYTFFDAPFVYYHGATPDSLELIFASSSRGSDFIGNEGSTLYIDNVGLEFSK